MFWCWTRRAVVFLAAVGIALSSSACDDVKDPYTFSATPTIYTETFTGTLAAGEAKFHPFIVTVSGTVTLTLTSVTPNAAQQLGFDIGTWDGTACNPVFGSGLRDAVQGNAFAGSAVVGAFCARVYDAQSRIPADTTVTYAIKVDHP